MQADSIVWTWIWRVAVLFVVLGCSGHLYAIREHLRSIRDRRGC